MAQTMACLMQDQERREEEMSCAEFGMGVSA